MEMPGMIHKSQGLFSLEVGTHETEVHPILYITDPQRQLLNEDIFPSLKKIFIIYDLNVNKVMKT